MAENSYADYAEDFGRWQQCVPARIVRRDPGESIAAALREASAEKAFVIRGAGHSCGGQTLCEDGAVLIDSADQAAIRIEGDGAVELSASARWIDVERVLNQRGRSVPVLTDYLDLSVGGTLSVGGYGVRSLRLGGQVDHVNRLRLTTPDGVTRWCSRTDAPELYRAALAGGGRCGLIDRVVLRTIKYRPWMQMQVFAHSSLAQLGESTDWLADSRDTEPSSFLGVRLQSGTITSQYGIENGDRRPRSALALPCSCARRGPIEIVDEHDHAFKSHARRAALVASFRDHARLWMDHVFAPAALHRYLEHLDGALREPGFARHLWAIYVLAIRRAPDKVELPFEAASHLSSPISFGVGLYYFVPLTDRAAIAETSARLHETSLTAIELGGRPYLYGLHRLDEAARRRLYGEHYRQWIELKRSIDPRQSIPIDAFPGIIQSSL